MARRALVTSVTGWALAWIVAAPALAAPCQIGTFDPSTATFFLDLDGNGVWDEGSDEAFPLARFASTTAPLPSIPVVGDWDGDGDDDVGRVHFENYDVRFFLDRNGNRAWDGIAGGDANLQVAAGFAGSGRVVVLKGNPPRVGWFFFGLPGVDRFFLSSVEGGAVAVKRFAIYAQGSGALVGDWDGDGDDELGKTVQNKWQFRDANGNEVWDGIAGGDQNLLLLGTHFFTSHVVGDWNGDGRDEVGGADILKFVLDLDGDGALESGEERWQKLDVHDAHIVHPLVCDWDGDGDDDVGDSDGTTFRIDLNGNLLRDPPGGGDRETVFAPPGIVGNAIPIAGAWTVP